jgi:hypothetical protein
MDYAMLLRLQIQSAKDQEDYLRLPAIVTGSTALALPAQLACWFHPLARSKGKRGS